MGIGEIGFTPLFSWNIHENFSTVRKRGVCVCVGDGFISHSLSCPEAFVTFLVSVGYRLPKVGSALFKLCGESFHICHWVGGREGEVIWEMCHQTDILLSWVCFPTLPLPHCCCHNWESLVALRSFLWPFLLITQEHFALKVLLLLLCGLSIWRFLSRREFP